MPSSPSSSPAPSHVDSPLVRHSAAPFDLWRWLLPIALALAAGCCAVSPESFWIDEGHSAWWSVQPNLPALWQAIMEVPSDAQMSLYALQLWVWEKLAGSSEVQLRLNNVGWLVVCALAWFGAAPRRSRPLAMGLVLLSPFAWAYVNEIRPYAMLLAGASLMAAALWRCMAGNVSQGWLCCGALGGVIALAATSAAIPWVGICWLGLAWLAWKEGHRLPSGSVGLFILAGLGIVGFDFWSFLGGNRPMSPAANSLLGLCFIPYELYGFAGLGPARADLRGLNFGTIKYYSPMLLALATALGCVAVSGWREFQARVGIRAALGWTVFLALPALVVIALGCKTGLRTSGRHLTPMLAFSFPLFIAGLDRLWQQGARRKAWWPRAAVIGLLLCWALSSLQLRFATRHEKENYRDAAAQANAALRAGERVWWSADNRTAEYYRLPLTRTGEQGKARIAINEDPLPAESPEWVFSSRPDVYDTQGTLARMLAENYKPAKRFKGFTVWQLKEPGR